MFDTNDDINTKLNDKEVRLMAKPIEANPVLKGEDLRQLIEDSKRPDQGQDNRRIASDLLKKLTSGGFR